jgi:hypothetical protein
MKFLTACQGRSIFRWIVWKLLGFGCAHMPSASGLKCQMAQIRQERFDHKVANGLLD